MNIRLTMNFRRLMVMLSLTLAANSHAAEPDLSSKFCPAFTVQDRIQLADPKIHLEDLSFPACNGSNIKAYLVGPAKPGKAKQPAILFVHWYDPREADSNREEFLAEAKALANKGVTSLLISTFWSEPNAPYHQRRWQDDYQNSLNQTRDLLRALSYLRGLPQVDSKRVAYVGHDYGAGFGALVAGADASVKGFVLMATPPELTDWYLYGSASGKPEGEALSAFRESFKNLSPINSLARSKAQVFMQFAENDPYVSPGDVEKFREAVPKAKIALYPTDHGMKLEKVREERNSWLVQLLTL